MIYNKEQELLLPIFPDVSHTRVIFFYEGKSKKEKKIERRRKTRHNETNPIPPGLCVLLGFCFADTDSGPDFEEIIYSLDKSASVASLLSIVEQKFADHLDPAFLDSGVDGEDYEKHAEAMRNKVKSMGMEERLIEVRRVTKVVKGGNILSFRAIVAVGNKKGKVAVGVGKGKEVMPATTKAVAEALRNIITFPQAKNGTIPHTSVGSATSASVIIKPAGEGTGVIAGGATRTVLELAGVENVLSKQLGSDSHLNNARATIDALAKLRSPKEVANLRGKTVRQLFGLDPPSKTVVKDSVSAERLQELVASCDTKTIEQIYQKKT